MVATSLHEPEVRCSSTLYPGTHQTLQREPPAKAADPKRPNKGGADPTKTGHVCLSGDGSPCHDSSPHIRHNMQLSHHIPYLEGSD